LNEHAAVMQRARAAVSKLNGKISIAQQNGALVFFNAEYRRRRIEARGAGKYFMSYGTALAKLRRQLVQAATGSSIEGMVERVFGEPKISVK
jgi:hypothetical protein